MNTYIRFLMSLAAIHGVCTSLSPADLLNIHEFPDNCDYSLFQHTPDTKPSILGESTTSINEFPLMCTISNMWNVEL